MKNITRLSNFLYYQLENLAINDALQTKIYCQKMVEVFKTTVKTKSESEMILNILLEKFPNHSINFDLEDCDKILRIEGNNFNTEIIINTLKEFNCVCEILE